MPLLCPRVFILLLLPLLALSCNSTKSLDDIAGDYEGTIKAELQSEEENIKSLIKQNNTVCTDSKRKLRCSSSPTNLTTTLLTIACRVNHHLQSFHQTPRVTESVQHSLGCFCPEQSNKEPRRSGRTRSMERHKPSKHRKLCRAKTLLASLAECYQLLNTMRRT